MRRHIVLGALTILVTVPGLFTLTWLAIAGTATLTPWFLARKAVLGVCLIVAGVLLILGHRHQHVAGATAWVLEALDCGWSLVALRGMADYSSWFGAWHEVAYLIAGVYIATFLCREQSQTRAPVMDTDRRFNPVMTFLPTMAALLFAAMAIVNSGWLLHAYSSVAKVLTFAYGWNPGCDAVVGVAGFGAAAFLAWRRSQAWPPAAILMCGYVLIMDTVPLLDAPGVASGPPALADIVARVWNSADYFAFSKYIVLPILPAIVIPLAALGWLCQPSTQPRKTLG